MKRPLKLEKSTSYTNGNGQTILTADYITVGRAESREAYKCTFFLAQRSGIAHYAGDGPYIGASFNTARMDKDKYSDENLVFDPEEEPIPEPIQLSLFD